MELFQMFRMYVQLPTWQSGVPRVAVTWGPAAAAAPAAKIEVLASGERTLAYGAFQPRPDEVQRSGQVLLVRSGLRSAACQADSESA
jgi:hypothetical protein